MKSVVAVVIAALAMVLPASASPITIEFTSALVPPGDNGGLSYIGVTSSTVASGADLAISAMIVSGDGVFDGTYAVTGSVAGFGALSFDTGANSVQIVGGIPSPTASLILLDRPLTPLTAARTTRQCLRQSPREADTQRCD
jgi:hypothetical protein